MNGQQCIEIMRECKAQGMGWQETKVVLLQKYNENKSDKMVLQISS